MRYAAVLFLACFCLIVVLKFLPVPGWYVSVLEHQESDLFFYETMARGFLGEAVVESPRFYQYPPLYSLLLVPGVLAGDLFLYVLVMDAVFAVLVFIALVFFVRGFVSEPVASLVAVLVCSADVFLVPVKSFGYPVMFLSLLFILVLYFFKGRRWLASVFFMLMVAASYVSWFLVPLVLLLFFLERKGARVFLRSVFFFLLPGGLVFLGWCLRNVLVHGLSLGGAVGGYSSLVTGSNVFVNVSERLVSFFVYLEPLLVLTYSLVFFIGFMMVRRRQREHVVLFSVLFLNLLFFVFVPGLLWDLPYLAWRYVVFLMPVYLALGLYPCFLFQR